MSTQVLGKAVCVPHGVCVSYTQVAEAVNLAPSDWLPFGSAAVTKYRAQVTACSKLKLKLRDS